MFVIKLGVSSACLYPLETEAALTFLGENGVKTTEIFFNSLSELNIDFLKKLKSICSFYGIEVHSVHPFASFGEHYNLFSEYYRRFEDGLELHKRYSFAASELGAKVIVMHGDNKPIISDDEYCCRFLKLIECSEQFGVVTSQENVNTYRSGNPNFIKMLCDNLQEKIKFTYDVKQCLRAGADPFDMLNIMKGKIVNFHISDNGEKGDCLLPGDGSFDFKKLFKTISAENYNCPALIEVYRHSYENFSDIPVGLKYLSSLIG